jgi:sporulation protein YlmC with PRC-barrel domain
MRPSFLTAGAVLLLCQATAIAQTNAPNTASGATPPAVTSAPTTNSGTPLRNRIDTMLQQSGFTEIHVMPSSFVIHAKDQDGNPIVMSITPDSVTAVAAITNPSDAQSTGTVSPGGAQFVTIDDNDKLSSNLIGLDVYNNSNQNVGQIKDIALDPQGQAKAYIVSVGGFLGMGTRYVALNPNAVKVSYNDSDKKWHATTDASADQLKTAPQFQYNGRWVASKS